MKNKTVRFSDAFTEFGKAMEEMTFSLSAQVIVASLLMGDVDKAVGTLQKMSPEHLGRLDTAAGILSSLAEAEIRAKANV